jgi:hypothetical protein
MSPEVKVATYLLTWNPDRWCWTEEKVQGDIANVEELGPEEYQRRRGSNLSVGTNYRRSERLGVRPAMQRMLPTT